jgi:L-rhamnose mutarotase
MTRVSFLLKVRPVKIEEYKRHNQAVWPEKLAALSRTGWHNYSLFMRPDGRPVGYFDTPESFQAAQARAIAPSKDILDFVPKNGWRGKRSFPRHPFFGHS